MERIMYKVEHEEIERKISSIKTRKISFFMLCCLAVLLAASGFELVEESDKLSIVMFTVFLIWFVYEFIKFSFIDPLLKKQEQLESDIKRLKEKVKLEDEKLY